MAGNFRRTRIKGWYEFYRETCPVCHKRGGCMINEQGDTVVCIRIESDIQFSKSFPSWVHKLKESRQRKPSQDASGEDFVSENSKVAPEMLNKVYQSLIDCTYLTDTHYEHLSKRGMTNNEIFFRQYRSFPDKPWETVKSIAELTKTNTFKGIPGFFENKYGWSISGRNGILIPYRNERNQIIGFQIRIDNPPNDVEITPGSISGLQARVKEQPNLVQILIDGEIIEEVALEIGQTHGVYIQGGAGFVKLVKGQRYFWLSSSTKPNGTAVGGGSMPVHVACPTEQLKHWKSGLLKKASSVWITEGALKADIAVEHIPKVFNEKELNEIGITFLAIAGVNCWRSVLPILERMEVKHVNIAFDMDAMENPYVLYYLRQLSIALKNRGYSASLVIWSISEGKGIDDAIAVSHRIPTFKKLF